jgi:hypothetical protein
MKKYYFIKVCLTSVLLLCVFDTRYAFADLIQPEHRVCKQDEDCALIYIGCACLCGGEDHIEALNKNYIVQFKSLEHCTDAENKSCAESGACARMKTPVAVCQNKQCVVTWQPNRK